jgi:hypothetical protein
MKLVRFLNIVVEDFAVGDEMLFSLLRSAISRIAFPNVAQTQAR